MSKEYNLICSICGKNYTGKSAKFKVCDDCRKPIVTKCSVCGKDITLTDYYMRKYLKGELDINEMTCSSSCHNKKIRDRGFNIICRSCGKEFHAEKSGELYCKECLSPIEVICPVCGNSFITNYRQRIKLLKNPNERILCSRSCTAKSGLKSYERKTGYKNPSCNPSIVKKREDRYYKKTGYRSSFGNPETRKKIDETIQSKYGVPYACMTDACRKSSETISKVNKYYYDYFGCDAYEFRIGKYSYDLKVGDILIEIDPTYTHNSTNPNRYGRVTDKNYQYEKTVLSLKNGYRCIHVFDWDDDEKIKNILPHDVEIIYARKCDIKEVDKNSINEFLNKYHLQGTVRGQDVRLGLYYDGELVQVMTFGKSRYNKNYQYELLRLCTNPLYAVVGGAERLFKYFIKLYNPSSIISYCDNAKFSGVVYKKLGMKLDSFGTPTAHWYNVKTGEHIIDSQLRKYGFDKLVGSRLNPPEIYGKGTSNEDLMVSHGFVTVYDAGQSRYVWDRSLCNG